jgi:hypothetical protein
MSRILLFTGRDAVASELPGHLARAGHSFSIVDETVTISFAAPQPSVLQRIPRASRATALRIDDSNRAKTEYYDPASGRMPFEWLRKAAKSSALLISVTGNRLVNAWAERTAARSRRALVLAGETEAYAFVPGRGACASCARTLHWNARLKLAPAPDRMAGIFLKWLERGTPRPGATVTGTAFEGRCPITYHLPFPGPNPTCAVCGKGVENAE